jgi:hypothetical protein
LYDQSHFIILGLKSLTTRSLEKHLTTPIVFNMKFLTILFMLATFFFAKLVMALPAGNGITSLITESGTLFTNPDGFQYLELREDFDPSHPALNITLVLSLLAENKPLPRLPGVPYDNPSSYRLPAGSTKCETSGGSPNVNDVDFVGNQLVKLGNAGVFCCKSAKGQNCSPLWWQGTAISDLCNFKGKQKVCIKCDIAGNAVKDVRAKCESNGKAGGYVR